MSTERRTAPVSVSRGAIGGAASGSGHRFQWRVAAYFAAHGITEAPLRWLWLPMEDAIPSAISLEVDEAIDDVAVVMTAGASVYVQAKEYLDKSEAAAAVAQWKRALSDKDAIPGRAVIAFERGSKFAHDLARALDRVKYEKAGNASKPERAALDWLATELGSKARFKLACSRCILRAGAFEPGILAAVVEVTGLGGAHDSLINIAGQLAGHRAGLPAKEWARRLAEAGVDLRENVNAVDLANALRFMRKYGADLIEASKWIDLRRLGAEIEPLPYSEVAAEIDLHDVENSGHQGKVHSPLRMLRRIGHVLITGPPGSGKSTFLTQLAATALQSDLWEVVLRADLRNVLRHLERSGVLEAVVSAAFEEYSDDPARRAATSHAVKEIREGRALVFLDGLDECGSKRGAVIEKLGVLIRRDASQSDFVIATRDVAYSQAATLGLRGFKVQPPSDTRRIQDAIIDAAARTLGKDDGWADERKRWVTSAMAGDRRLASVPLLPVLLALTAVSAPKIEHLPTGQAAMLWRLVEDVIERFEGRKERHDLGADEKVRLREAFACEAKALQFDGGAVPRAVLVERVTELFQAQFGDKPGTARAHAEASVDFWDEHGLFVASGAEHVVQPSLQLVMEIGAAREILSIEADRVGGWVEERVDDDVQHQVLLLGAVQRVEAFDALVGIATARAEPKLLRVALKAIVDSATATTGQVDAVAIGLVTSSDPEAAWEDWLQVSRLPLSETAQLEALRIVEEKVDEHDRQLARAIAILAWDWEGRDDELLAFVGSAAPPKIRSGSERKNPLLTRDTIFRVTTVKVGWMRAVTRTAMRFAESHPELLDRAVDLHEEAGGMTLDNDFVAFLNGRGRGDLVELNKKRYVGHLSGIGKKWAGFLQDYREDVTFLECLRSRLSAARDLTPVEARRLTGLAQIAETSGMSDAGAGYYVRSLANDTVRVVDFVLAIANLGGVRTDQLAAEVDVALPLAERDDPSWTLGHGDVEPLTLDWSVATDEDIEAFKKALQGLRWPAEDAAMLLSEHPDMTFVKDLALSALVQAPPNARDTIARLAIYAAELAEIREWVGQWILGDDPVLQQTAAWWYGRAARTSDSGAERGFDHEDAQVRQSLLDGARSDGEHPGAVLQQLASAPRPSKWTCDKCWVVNELELDKCESCNRDSRPSELALGVHDGDPMKVIRV